MGRVTSTFYWKGRWRVGKAYELAVRALLLRSPHRIWRWPAHVSAAVRSVADAGLPDANAVLTALGVTPTPTQRWRFRWAVAYQDATDRLLQWQQTRITSDWIQEHVLLPERALPEGGAIVLILHQANMRLLAPPLRAHSDKRLGIISLRPVVTRGRAQRTIEPFMRATFDAVFTPQQAARGGLRLLREGGYLIIPSDVASPDWPDYPLLGRDFPLPPGPLWFAERAGKPIVACVLTPQGRRWRVWVSESIHPSPHAIAAARESCVRRAATMWNPWFWHLWHIAPSSSLETVKIKRGPPR
jgi:hypothetical protein